MALVSEPSGRSVSVSVEYLECAAMLNSFRISGSCKRYPNRSEIRAINLPMRYFTFLRDSFFG